jgi:uncharacterized repeat protein (TIGR01451 family)
LGGNCNLHKSHISSWEKVLNQCSMHFLTRTFVCWWSSLCLAARNAASQRAAIGALGALVISTLSVPHANAQVLYGVGGAIAGNPAACQASTTLYTVNQTTGAATAITTTMLFESVALAINPLNGLVYYFQRNTADAQIAVFNPATPAVAHTSLGTPVAGTGIPLNAGSGVLRASFSPDGRLYAATNSGVFYEMNITTGAIIRSFQSNLPLGGSGDFAFAPNGDLYVVANDSVAGNPYQLWRFTAADVAAGATAPSTTTVSGTAVGANLGIAATIAPNGLAVIPPTGTCTNVCFAMSTGLNNVTYLVDGTSGAATPISGAAATSATGFCLTDLARGYFTDLAIQKTGPATYVSGAPVSYTFRVWNNGPATPIAGSTITDVVPANLTGVTWTCAATGTASCGASTSGTGNINHTTSSLTLDPAPTNAPNTNFLTFTINATAGAAAPGMTNTASVTAPAAVSDTNTANNSSTVNSNVSADLSVDKVVAPIPYVPGGPITYTIKVWNQGPNPITGATLADTFPVLAAGGTNWTYSCVASGTATCGAIPTAVTTAASVNAITGLLPINATATAPTTGSFLTITATATTAAGQAGVISNTASVSVPTGATDPTPGNNSATAVDSPSLANLTISKTDNKTTTISGATNTYTIVVANAGPSAANGAVVTDPSIAGLTCSALTCAVTTGAAVCPAAPTVAALQGAGLTIPTLPATSSVTFTLTCNATATGS